MLRQGEGASRSAPVAASIPAAPASLLVASTQQAPGRAEAARGARGALCPGELPCADRTESLTVPTDGGGWVSSEGSSVGKCAALSLCSRQYRVGAPPSCP